MTFLEHGVAVTQDAKQRLTNRIQINVYDDSAVYTLNEDSVLDDCWDWDCQHVNTTIEKIDKYFNTFTGPESYPVKVETCDACGEEL